MPAKQVLKKQNLPNKGNKKIDLAKAKVIKGNRPPINKKAGQKPFNKNVSKNIAGTKPTKGPNTKQKKIIQFFNFCAANSVIFKGFKIEGDKAKRLRQYLRLVVKKDVTSANGTPSYYLANLNPANVDEEFVGKLLVKDIKIYDDNNVLFVLEEDVQVTAEPHISLKSNKLDCSKPKFLASFIKTK